MGKYDTLPDCLPYHPNSELRERSGYYPNISREQLKAASDLIALIEKEGLNFNSDDEHEFLKLLRFLRARKFNVEHAMKMVREDVEWRSQENRLNIRSETAEEVIGCSLNDIFRYFPAWMQGVDKQMRPVSYRKFGYFETWNVLKLTTMPRLLRFHAWETEQALRSMYATSRDQGYNIETFVIVVDAAHWSLRLATNDAYTFIKGMASTDSDHYPERLGSIFVINAPHMLSIAWKVVQAFLDPVTKKKVHIISNRREWEPVLRKHIDVDLIPKQYGGNAPDPTGEEALRGMGMNPAAEGDEGELNAEMKAAFDKEEEEHGEEIRKSMEDELLRAEAEAATADQT